MRTALKIRTVLLLAAVLFTGLALALPQPAQACWINFVQDCVYPNGTHCYTYCPQWAPSCTGPTEGTPSCSYPGDEYCCPR